uniref:Uncharacterized protein n=1 Tax=Neobodo designis TaxID=312471 RepID=A0A7S1MI26_NEODS|mmetsp:Transcript_41090/g.126866  ORF Transcript_41090/g.126866 Transcript_41090/m.126866 type:complete len:165 (+) Transcript_41090:94-588(+)
MGCSCSTDVPPGGRRQHEEATFSPAVTQAAVDNSMAATNPLASPESAGIASPNLPHGLDLASAVGAVFGDTLISPDRVDTFRRRRRRPAHLSAASLNASSSFAMVPVPEATEADMADYVSSWVDTVSRQDASSRGPHPTPPSPQAAIFEDAPDEEQQASFWRGL